MISVVLPTRNRLASLLRCLESLERQSPANDAFEVIVVDDGSEAPVEDALAEFKSRTPLRLTVARQEHRGPGAARNRGASLASGRILAFIEDDVTAEPGWLAAGAEALDRGAAAAEGMTRVEGDSVRVFDAPGGLAFLPCNFFVRKEAFTAVGGYDEGYFDPHLDLYFREDADFGFRLLERGLTVVQVPAAVVTHPPQFALPASPWRHLRRYYFDPLLARNHPLLYRERIEVKRLGGLTLRRPFHYASLASLVGWVFLAAAWAASSTALAAAGGAIVLSALCVLQYRYTHRWVPANVREAARCVAFFTLPFYYEYWHLRGCRRFRYWKTLF